MEARAKELYEKVITMDLGGRTGSYYDENVKATISYVEAAEFALAQTATFSRKPDPAPLQAFIKKYPSSKFIKDAYSYLSYYYRQMAPKEDAVKFFEEYTAKFPEDKNAVRAYIQRIIKDKDPLDKGIALAEKLREDLSGYPLNPSDRQDLAELYALKDDPAKVEETYGKDFLDGYLSNAYYAVIGYANFWVDREKNLESAEAAADLALKLQPDDWFSYAQVANIYTKVDKTDKALAIFGPEFVKKFANDQSALSNYATFWGNASMNLESALDAAKRSVALASDYYNNFVLAQVLFKMKTYPEALKAAEKAVELLKPIAAKNPNYPTQRFDDLVKQIKEAMAKGPGAEIKK